MDRRKALKITAGVFAGTIIGSDYFLLGCAPDPKMEELLTKEEVLFLDDVGETILPESSKSPGAKTAKIGLFMKSIVEDCYTATEQKIFKNGILHLNKLSEKRFGNSFRELTLDERHLLLVDLDNEVSKIKANHEVHYFTMIKQLTIWGYFTSEPGTTQALRYNPIPGRYNGCVPYKNGEKAWA
ncbi:hypothetical protein KCTC52924_03686 [Arenibacter antarcticus]|uniref:Gluconate 2-dehydrogenase subunit 3 family protein n=1 Tax=Arenibacter antarcticus TaxID=2040469 RepID=A0ABW5VI42_9FLAO|nr:gluconate 2-dehydrogenase subunit 3 family protein [Arenibacter sp. H213]MCM4168132.1 twin-arginine translocation pathway signal protein [Arenibacter sp. H213]